MVRTLGATTTFSIVARGATGLAKKIKGESRQSDSNRRPAVYKTAALPLSYVGVEEKPIFHTFGVDARAV